MPAERFRRIFYFMDGKGNVYLIRVFNSEESFYKVGVTVHRYCRFYQIMKYGYSITIEFMIMGLDYFEALSSEEYLLSSPNKYKPKIKFGGYTECFSSIDIRKMTSIADIYSHTEIVKNLEISWR